MREHIIETVKNYVATHGKKPQLREFKVKNGYSFSKDTITKYFGTFNSLLIECGLNPQNRGESQYNKIKLTLLRQMDAISNMLDLLKVIIR